MFIFTVGDLIGIAYLAIAVMILLGIALGEHLKKMRRKYPRK